MFSLPKLPTQLPNAFGLLGDDAKLTFRTGANGIRRLAEEKNISLSDEAYWSQYITLFDSASDVFTLISPNDVYRALHLCPENISTLIRYLIIKLASLIGDHSFPSPPPSISSTLNPLNSLPINITSNSRNPTKEALNCIRILSRVFPVVFGFEVSGWEDALMWKREQAPPVAADDQYGSSRRSSNSESAQFVIEDEDDDEQVTTPMLARTASQQASTASQLGPSLAEKLINTLIELLFCCGFTLPTKVQIDHHKLQYIIWEKGVGSTFTPSSTSREQSYVDNNRVEVLRLLLILLSKQIYSSPSSIIHKPSKYTHYLVQKVSRKSVLTVLCSLINVIANFSSVPPPGTPTGGIGAGIAGVGKGISKGLNQLPYTQVWKGEDSREMLVCTAAQVLVVVLDYQSGNARDIQSASSITAEPHSPAPVPETAHPNPDLPYGQNVPATPSASNWTGAPSPKSHHFRYFLSKIHRPADMTYLLDGILGVLGEEIRKGGSLLGIGLGALQGVGVKAAGPKSPGCAQEVLLILWKLLEVNKKFRKHVMEGDRAMDVMACILAYGLELKDKPKSNGACRCLSYMLQFLSAEPGFGPQLSTVPIRIPLPNKWNVVGTSADFLISSIHAIISAGSVSSSGESVQNPLNNISTSYPAFIISLANAAPYLKNISISSGHKLMELFTAFSDPRLLLADEGNPRLVYFMLDAFNSIITRHPSQNPHLLYAMLRSHVLFEDLGTFTLARGLRDIKRREEEERNKNLTSPTHAKGKSPTRGEDNTGQQAHEEKARLLAAEGVEPHSGGENMDRNGASIDASLGNMRISSPPPTSSSSWEGHGAAGTSDDGTYISEKARGKMRQRNESLDVTAELAAAAQIGRNGFIPTQEWVTSWQQGLPLDPILLAISELLPKVQQIQSSMTRTTASPAVLDFLKVVDLKAVLPQRPTLTPRPFIWTESSLVWLSSLIWGEIYVKGMSPLGLWNGTNVRLFYVKQAQPQGRQITDTVSNVVGGILGRSDSATRVRV